MCVNWTLVNPEKGSSETHLRRTLSRERINVPVCQHLGNIKKTYLSDHQPPRFGTLAANVWTNIGMFEHRHVQRSVPMSECKCLNGLNKDHRWWSKDVLLRGANLKKFVTMLKTKKIAKKILRQLYGYYRGFQLSVQFSLIMIYLVLSALQL